MDDSIVNLTLEENRKYAELLNDQMRRAVMPVTVIVGIEVFLGLFGNLLVLYVFLFRYHPCNYRYFVVCLALTDVTSSLTTMPGEMVTQLFWYVYPVPLICKIKSFFNVFTVCSEALCLLVIAIDRYRKVCTWMQWQISDKTALVLCGGIYIVALILAIPVAIFWGTHTDTEHYNDIPVNVTVCEIDQSYIESSRPLQYSIAVEAFISFTLVSMFILYILIARALICKGRGRGRHYERGGRDVPRLDMDRHAAVPARTDVEKKVKQKTLIMFILTVIFIITIILYTTLLSLIANDILPTLSDGERALYFFFFRLYFINHVINPVVYGLLDQGFRKHIFGSGVCSADD